MTVIRHIALICLILLLQLPAALATSEEILSFESRVLVRKDASLLVTETITVRAMGYDIKRGIYRDFPTIYTSGGIKTVVRFDVISVSRDGHSEPYHIKNQSNGVRVYIGQKNKFISKGVHTYQISYTTDQQLGFFKDYDELYWNVTGQEWAFPIRKASAVIEVEGVSFDDLINFGGFTGETGSKETHYDVGSDHAGNIKFYSTRTFQPGEGFTIYVTWPKGVIQEPSQSEKVVNQISSNLGAFIGIAGFCLVLLYYLLMWVKVGKDPSKGTIVPLFEAPNNLSPAAVRYIDKMGYDSDCMGAAILQLAVKGVIHIEESGNRFTLSLTGEGDVLTADEKKLKSKLFGVSKEIELHHKNHRKIKSAITAFKEALALKFETTHFHTNRKFFYVGLGMSILFIVAGAVVSEVGAGVFIVLWLSIWSVGVFFLLSQVIERWKAVIYGSENRFLAIPAALFMTAFSIPFVGGEIVGIFMMGSLTSPILVLILLFTILLNVLFFNLLKAPTRMGRRVMDQIEGFKLFLSAVEEDRLNRIYPVDVTPEVFEKFLPYAFALGVEQNWAERFNRSMEKAGLEPTNYSPLWLHGSSFASMSTAQLSSALGNSFSSAISSSSHAPGSSSGSGGGGSSGGGGGGGGGGGW